MGRTISCIEYSFTIVNQLWWGSCILDEEALVEPISSRKAAHPNRLATLVHKPDNYHYPY
jgi:hypothetical protein